MLSCAGAASTPRARHAPGGVEHAYTSSMRASGRRAARGVDRHHRDDLHAPRLVQADGRACGGFVMQPHSSAGGPWGSSANTDRSVPPPLLDPAARCRGLANPESSRNPGASRPIGEHAAPYIGISNTLKGASGSRVQARGVQVVVDPFGEGTGERSSNRFPVRESIHSEIAAHARSTRAGSAPGPRIVDSSSAETYSTATRP